MTPNIGDLEELGSRAHILATFGRHREAIELINVAIWRYPNDKRLYNNRCCSYIQTYDLQNALSDAEYLIENFPDFVKGYVRKGEVLTIMKRYAEAEREYKTALELVEDEDIHVHCLQLQLLQIISRGFEPYSAWKALCETGNVQQSLRLLKTSYRKYEHVVNAIFHGETYFKQNDEGGGKGGKKKGGGGGGGGTFSEDDADDEDEESVYELESNLLNKKNHNHNHNNNHNHNQNVVKKKLNKKVFNVIDEIEHKNDDKMEKENNLYIRKKMRKKLSGKQNKVRKIIRKNKKKLLLIKRKEKPDNILTVRNI